MEYDDHCRLTVLGEEMWIVAMEGSRRVYLRGAMGRREIIDVSRANMAAYVEACEAQIDGRYVWPTEAELQAAYVRERRPGGILDTAG